MGLAGGLATNGGILPGAGRAQAALTSRGLLAEAFQMASAAGGTTVSTQQIWCSLVGLNAGDVVTNVVVGVSTAAAGTVPTLIKLALVDTGGVVLAATGNVNSDAKWTSLGLPQFPLASPFTVTTTGGYYVALLQNGAFVTTPLQILREGGTPAQLGQKVGGTGARLFALGGTGQTDITGTLTLADGGSGVSPWFGVS